MSWRPFSTERNPRAVDAALVAVFAFSVGWFTAWPAPQVFTTGPVVIGVCPANAWLVCEFAWNGRMTCTQVEQGPGELHWLREKP